MSNENKPAGPKPRVRLEMGSSAPAGEQHAAAQTPTQQVLSRGAQSYEVTDAKGRRFTLRRPASLTLFRFVEMLGQAANNDRYFSMVLPLLFIVAIDDDPQPPPARKSELEALIKQLEDEGLETVALGVQKHFDRNPDETVREEVKS